MAILESTDRLRELALFAGAGGGILGGRLLGWRTVCAVEFDQYAASVLVARQNDGCLEPFPIWDDVRTFDGTAWRGRVDVVSGGFPCQDISAAGKGAGIDGERSGLWSEMARIIGEVRPRFAFVENSPMLTSRGLGRVLGDLAEMGYDSRWGVMGACCVGLPHKRKRLWLVADSATIRWNKTADAPVDCVMDRPEGCVPISRSPQAISTRDSRQARRRRVEDLRVASRIGTREPEPARVSVPGMDGMADGLAARMDRLRAIGNGQVPSVARLAWRILTDDA